MTLLDLFLSVPDEMYNLPWLVISDRTGRVVTADYRKLCGSDLDKAIIVDYNLNSETGDFQVYI